MDGTFTLDLAEFRNRIHPVRYRHRRYGKLYSMPTDGESWTYLGQRDGSSLYFMHSDHHR